MEFKRSHSYRTWNRNRIISYNQSAGITAKHRKMKKHILTLLLTVFISTATFAQVKVGYMNPLLVLDQLEEVKKVDEEINTLVDTRDQALIAKATQLQSDFATFEQGKGVLSPEARSTKEQEFIDRNDELEAERTSYLSEIQQKRSQLMAPLIERMNSAIAEVATEMGLELILNETTGYGEAIIFFAGEEGINITAKVLDKLKAE